MENASKALLMAGGILIALLVISALILMFNQIGDYGKSQEEMKRNSQLVEFNKDFERYLENKGITGADVISLFNKVNDYNHKTVNVSDGEDAEKTLDYTIKIKLTVYGLDKFNETYASDLFSKSSYTIANSGTNYKNNELKEALDKGKEAEARFVDTKELTTDQLKQLSSLYDKKDVNNSKNAIKEKYKEMNNRQDIALTESEIKLIVNYREYWEFKTAKFKPYDDITNGIKSVGYASSGQINEINIKFEK